MYLGLYTHILSIKTDTLQLVNVALFLPNKMENE